jgi:predicted aspartyl protease
MGETRTKIKVSPLSNKKSTEIEVLVDTGATYTALPEMLLETLGVKREGKVNIEFANGQVEPRDLGNVFLEVSGRRTVNPVLFGRPSDAIVLGLVSLESCGLMVDPVSQKLVPLSKIHHYSELSVKPQFKAVRGTPDRIER